MIRDLDSRYIIVRDRGCVEPVNRLEYDRSGSID